MLSPELGRGLALRNHSSLVFNLRGGCRRLEISTATTFAGGYDPRNLGFPSSLVSQFLTLQFPVSPGTTRSVGAHASNQLQRNDTGACNERQLDSRRQAVKAAANSGSITEHSAARSRRRLVHLWQELDASQSPAGGRMRATIASFLLACQGQRVVDRNFTLPTEQYYAVFVHDTSSSRRIYASTPGSGGTYERLSAKGIHRLVRGFAFDRPGPLNAQVPGSTCMAVCSMPDRARPAFRIKSVPNCISPAALGWRGVQRRSGDPRRYGLTISDRAPPAEHRFQQPDAAVASTDQQHTPAVTLSDPFPRSLYPNGLLQPSARARVWPRSRSVITAQFLNSPATALSSILFRIPETIAMGLPGRCLLMSATSRINYRYSCL